MDNITTYLRALLNNFWILKEEEPSLYYEIKKNQNKIRDFLTKNLGSRLIVHDRFIKLEKLPSTKIEGVGIPNFSDSLDYILLCMILLFLEDKTRGEVFILSAISEYVKNTCVTLELEHIPDWNIRKDRSSFTRVMDYLREIGVIKVKDEETVSFQENQNAQVLYEATGLSNYVMRLFTNDIFEYQNIEDFLKDEWIYQNEEKGSIRRYRVYRNLLYIPVLYRKEVEITDYDYIKKLRGHMKEEFDELGYELEVTRNMAFLYEENNNQKENFPNNKKISDIVLMVNKRLYDMILQEEILLDEYEVGRISKESFEMILQDIRLKDATYLNKYFLGLPFSKFQEEILSYMKEYNFLKEDKDGYSIFPSIARFNAKLEKDENNQLELFGGVENV